MKRNQIYLLLFAMLFPASIFAQERKSAKKEVFQKVDQMPEFPGGIEQLKVYIANHLVYPPEASKKKIQGKVFVSFIVDKEGKVTNVEVVRGVDPLLDKAAFKVISELPQWKPGENKGKLVNVAYTIPVKFALN